MTPFAGPDPLPGQPDHGAARHRRPPRRRWRPVVAMLVPVVLVASGLGVRTLNGQAFTAGLAAERAGDCEGALSHYAALDGVRSLVGGGDQSRADAGTEACRAALGAADLRERGRYQEAVDAFLALPASHPDAEVGAASREGAAETYAAWGAELADQADFEGALERYATVGADFADTAAAEEARAAEAATRVRWADALAANGSLSGAVGQYGIAFKDFAGTEASADAETKLTELLSEAATAGKGASECRRVETLDAFVLNKVMGKEARPSLPKALLACAQWEHGKDRYRPSIGHYERLIDEFPKHELVGKATTGLIRVRVDLMTLNREPSLSAPTRVGSATGETVMKIRNASPAAIEFLFVGPTVTSLIVPACASCEVLTAPPTSCPSGAGAGSVTLAPGEYRMVAVEVGSQFPSATGRWTIEAASLYDDCFFQMTGG